MSFSGLLDLQCHGVIQEVRQFLQMLGFAAGGGTGGGRSANVTEKYKKISTDTSSKHAKVHFYIDS
jgi:hypothetical protein